MMKVTIFKRKGTKETLAREELDTIVRQIATGEYIGDIKGLRDYWHLMYPTRLEDGRCETNFNYKVTLPRLCFSAELQRQNGEQAMKVYNGLIVLEANNLSSYDEAIALRDKVARLPQTMLAFLGASGQSVKIVCRGELLPDNGGGVPT